MTKKIAKITDEQFSNILRDRDDIQNNFFKKLTLDKPFLENYITNLYKEEAKKNSSVKATPKFKYVKSPKHANQILNKRFGTNRVYYPFHYGPCSLSWVEHYTILERHIGFTTSETKELQEFRKLCYSCGWAYATEDVVYVTEHPVQLHYNEQHRLNKINGHAVEFSDGWGVCALDGVIIPKSFGLVSPETWNALEVLTYDNVEVRRVLLQAMGYEKVLSELSGKKLDGWREYTLYEVEVTDDENVFVLKMECPSTGHIHTLRVPPGTDAREAATWVNHGIDPTEFTLET